MPNHSIEAVIFDCDGTLVDSEVISLRVLVDYVKEFGLQIDHSEAMERYAGNELTVVFRDIENQLGHALPDDFLEQFRHRQLAKLRSDVLACDGADELLRNLTLPFCVASNAPTNKIEICLTTTGLIRHFEPDQIFSAYDIEKWKPAPDLFLLAAKSMNVQPQNCVVVEDSSFGVKAGLAAGMRVIAYQPRGGTLDAEFGIPQVQHLAGLLHQLKE